MSAGALVPGGAWASPEEAASSSSDESSAPREPLQVDVERTVTDAELFPEWIRERNPDLEAKYPDADGTDQWIVVDIRGKTYNYRLQITAMREGRPVGAEPRIITCECSSEHLLEVINGGIEKAVVQLKTASVDEDTKRRRKRDGVNLGALGASGIVLGVVGMGAISVGIPIALRDERTEWNVGRLKKYSTRVPGVVVAVAGGVLLTAGIALLVESLSESKVVAVAPTVGLRSAGVMLRFRM